MSHGFLNVAMTPSVRAAQAAMGSDRLWRDFKGQRDFDEFTQNEVAFIGERDSFYMATVSETGWPYVQHRGGPKGFLKVLDEKTLAFADYRGNRQYISLGNLDADDRAALILMDYAGRARLKIYAHVEAVALDRDPSLAARVAVPGSKGKPERILVLRLVAFDWNCPQHITPRFTEVEINEAVQPLYDRLSVLEAENKTLRAQLAAKEIGEMMEAERPPLPPFVTLEAAARKVRLAEDAWNSRDADRVSLAYTQDSHWRNRAEFLEGRGAIVAFLTRKWTRELDYRLIKELWAFRENRIAVRFAYEWHDDSGNWFRSYGNELWEFDERGLMRRRVASINDAPIHESERRFHWPLGPRPEDHPSLSDLGM